MFKPTIEGSSLPIRCV